MQSSVATYDTEYTYGHVANVSRSSTVISGSTKTLSDDDPITLTADFGRGTLTGNGTTPNRLSLPSRFGVDGRIGSQFVSGTTTGR